MKLSSLSSAILVVTCTMFLISYVKLVVSWLYQTLIHPERTRQKEPDRLWDCCTIFITLLPPGKWPILCQCLLKHYHQVHKPECPIVEDRDPYSYWEFLKPPQLPFWGKCVAKPQGRSLRTITLLFLPLLVDWWPVMCFMSEWYSKYTSLELLIMNFSCAEVF